jgi:thymidylate synthase (FAD)
MMRHFEEGYVLYQEALEKGVAREQARLFLPGFSAYYTCIWKIDAHNLMHFLKLRMASDAQHEIRVYADTLYREIFKPLMPWTAEAFETFVMGKD